MTSDKNRTWQLQTAKSKFSEVVNYALKGYPQLITKNGKPAVYVISSEEYEKITGKVALKDVLQNSPHKDIEICINRQKETGRSPVI